MKKILTNNWGLKLAAILIAFLLWMIIVNVSNPDIIRTFTNIEIQIQNEQILTDANLSYEIQDDRRTASVVLKGPRSMINGMTSEDIIAVADFRNLTSANTVEIEYSFAVPYNMSASSFEYRSRTLAISLIIEDMETRTYPVEIQTTGTPIEGYVVESTTAEIAEVEVTAPTSVHDTIERVLLRINVNQLSEDQQLEVVPQIYSDTGYALTASAKATINVESIPVSINIGYTKTVPVTYGISGSAAQGYIVTDNRIDAGKVCLLGDKDVLDGIAAVTIPPEAVDVSDINENTKYPVDLANYLPDGVSFYDEQEKEKRESFIVTVSVEVEPLVTRSYTIQKSQILLSNTPENCSVDFTDRYDVTVRLTGLEEILEKFSAEDIYAYIDCTGVTTETRTVLLRIERLPEGIELSEQILLNITVKNLNEPPTAGSGETGGEDEEQPSGQGTSESET